MHLCAQARIEEKEGIKREKNKITDYSMSELYHLWHYFGGISHYPNNLSQEVTED